MGTDGTIRASSSPAVVGQNVSAYIPEQLAAGKGIRINPSVKTGTERILPIIVRPLRLSLPMWDCQRNRSIRLG